MKKKKVLLIEDDPDIRDVYSQTLKDEGIGVASAQTAGVALKKLKNLIPDLIVMDIMLPGGINGLDLLKILKGHDKFAKIPVIMLTNLDGTQKTARELGCADYVIKVNLSLDDFVRKIKKHLRK